MRKQYDFSKGARRNPHARSLRRARGRQAEPDDLPPLTTRQIQEIERRVRDSNDRTRYLLASVMTPRFILYYDLSDDSYIMNEPAHATLFKRRPAAAAIQNLLGSRIRIVKCRVGRSGNLVLGSLPAPFLRRRRRGQGAA
jgi:hypothetical protein